MKWNHRVEDKLLYRGVRLVSLFVRVVSVSRALSSAHGRHFSLTEALGVQFYCYRCSLLPSDSGKKSWKWALASICSHVSARVCTRKYWVFKIFGMVQIFVDLIFER